MLRRLSLLMFLLAAFLTAGAVTPYATLETKAGRYYRYGEWASASAMYTLMLHERPDSAAVWGHAIAASGLMNDPAEQLELVRRAVSARIPVDSIIAETRCALFEADAPALYEKFLYNIKEGEPWMNRFIDRCLLEHYTFRDNGPGIVTMSEIMLQGLPDDERFLYSLAHGQLLCGDVDTAISTYRRIVGLYPASYKALLYLGNHYADQGDSEKARDYLSRALAIRYTPYVEARLSKL